MKIFNRCYNGGNKHNFKPVYTEREAEWVSGIITMRGNRNLLVINEYVGHVCLWCGKKDKKCD